MRIAITANLLYTPGRHDMLSRMAERMMKERPDVLILAGNLGVGATHFADALTLFDGADCQRLLIAGNQDLWCPVDRIQSDELWASHLPAAADQHGFHWLEGGNIILDEIGFCGTLAWYDYSGRDAELGYSAEQYEELKGLVSEDARFIQWHYTDRQFSAMLAAAFADRLHTLVHRGDVTDVVVVTFFPVFGLAKYIDANDIQARFRSAFESNINLGRIIAPKEKVRYVISGFGERSIRQRMEFGMHSFNTMLVGSAVDMPSYVLVNV